MRNDERQSELVILDIDTLEPNALNQTTVRFPHSTIVTVSGHRSEKMCVAAPEIGADYIEAPFSKLDLIARVRAASLRTRSASAVDVSTVQPRSC
jgi:DNA-binding response OmpR family regulator